MKRVASFVVIFSILVVPFCFSAEDVNKEFWPNGQIKSEEPTVNGKREGMAHYWWENGKPYGAIPWKNGEKDGVFQLFRPDETVEMELSYKMGRQHGMSKWFYPDGKVKDQAEYQDGVLHGQRTKYKPDGTIDYEAIYEYGKFKRYVKSNEEVRTTKTIPNNISKETKYQIWYKKPSSKISSSGQSFFATAILNTLIGLSVFGLLVFFSRRKK